MKIITNSALGTSYLKAVKDYIQIIMQHLAPALPFLLSIGSTEKNGIVIGILYFILYLITSFAARNAKKFADFSSGKFDPVKFTLLSAFLLGTVSGIFFKQHLWIASLIVFTGIYIAENLRKPVLTGYVSDQVPNDILASVISAQSLLQTLFTALIAFLLGFFSDKFGFETSLSAISASLFVLWFVFFGFRKKQSKQQY